MARRGGYRSAFLWFVHDQLPELERRGLSVAHVADAVPYCSQAWEVRAACRRGLSRRVGSAPCQVALPSSPQRGGCAGSCAVGGVAASPAGRRSSRRSLVCGLPSLGELCVLLDIFYFLDIYSYGKLPPHCEQRFLPCEIGCVRYSLRDGIMADFHHFIDPEVPPRGFRYHCQAAGDETHKIPISGFHLPRSCYAVVLRELVEFAHPSRGAQLRFFCRFNDRFRINWCLGRMASIESHWELFAVEDLIMKLYQKKYQKEPSKIWVYRKLDVCLWDFSSNTRCKWHEENDIICCALASCKKISYCISKSFASVYGVPLTAAHLPLQDSDCDQSTNTRIVNLDAGHTQVRFFDVVQGRGVTRLLRSASDLSKSFSN
uniref:Maelstrom spermatogenic transposon silencer n=1 Tax=Serinus canaria TaxID=9135 RepID=A0A8C9NEF5_SERCA